MLIIVHIFESQVNAMVEDALIERFGRYAGWAHNTLFIAELSSHKVRASLLAVSPTVLGITERPSHPTFLP